MINFFGDQGNSAKIFGMKGTRGKIFLGNKRFYLWGTRDQTKKY